MLSEQEKKQCQEAIDKMERVSSAFYYQAIHVGAHAFIEFNGLMNEYIKICRQALEKGIDFRQANTHNEIALPMETFQMAYLAEKLDCIYGPTLRSSKQLKEAFEGHV